MQGGHPILSLGFNTTIAASMGGTAAATVINSSFPATYARYVQIYNYTLRDMELVFGVDPGTGQMTNVIYVPGIVTAAGTTAIQGALLPIAMSQGMELLARTTTNAPITVSSTLQLRMNFWA